MCVPVNPAAVDCGGATVLQQHSGADSVSGIVVGGWTITGYTYANPSTTGTPNGVTFSTLGGAGGAGDLTRIDVTNPNIPNAADMRWMAVTISASGQVAMCDPSPLLATDNPLHCN